MCFLLACRHICKSFSISKNITIKQLFPWIYSLFLLIPFFINAFSSQEGDSNMRIFFLFPVAKIIGGIIFLVIEIIEKINTKNKAEVEEEKEKEGTLEEPLKEKEKEKKEEKEKEKEKEKEENLRSTKNIIMIVFLLSLCSILAVIGQYLLYTGFSVLCENISTSACVISILSLCILKKKTKKTQIIPMILICLTALGILIIFILQSEKKLFIYLSCLLPFPLQLLIEKKLIHAYKVPLYQMLLIEGGVNSLFSCLAFVCVTWFNFEPIFFKDLFYSYQWSWTIVIIVFVNMILLSLLEAKINFDFDPAYLFRFIAAFVGIGNAVVSFKKSKFIIFSILYTVFQILFILANLVYTEFIVIDFCWCLKKKDKEQNDSKEPEDKNADTKNEVSENEGLSVNKQV